MTVRYFYITTLLLLFTTMNVYAQQVAINEDGSLPNRNAILDVKSFSKGILIPRMSSTNRLAIPHTKGLMVFDTTLNSIWYNTGAAWLSLAQGSIIQSGWSLTGNSGLTSNNFIGSTDNAPLLIKVNNQLSGRIDAGINTTWGNAFWGYKAGLNTPLIGNSGSSTGNTGIGFVSLEKNTTGSDNTAVGYAALWSNTNAFGNVAVGSTALQLNNGGSSNVAIGYAAMAHNVEGSSNVAIGMAAMAFSSSGNNNVAIGFNSFSSNNPGQFNTGLGANANVSASNLVNATAIGFGATVNASNKVRIGNASVTVIEGPVPFSTPSDGRFKYEVQENVKGLDFVLQLRPVTYQFDTRSFENQLHGNRLQPDSIAGLLKDSYQQASRIRRSGFIAQEVENAVNNSGYEFSGLRKPTSEQDYYSISYESFVVPLVKAVQELHAELAKLKQEKAHLVTDLQKQISELKQLLQQLK